MTIAMDDPVAFFRSVAAAHSRCFWLDGGGAREWSGRRSILGWLDDDDVSLSYSRARGEVTRCSSGRVTGGWCIATVCTVDITLPGRRRVHG